MSGDDLIVHDWPPNIAAVRKAFPGIIGRSDVIFAYAPYIFVPEKGPLHPALVAHELVHLDHQSRLAGGPEEWWRLYIEDAEFRLMEEMRAHYAEYKWHVSADPSRKSRRKHLAMIAGRLSSGLYGNMVSLDLAKRILLLGPDGMGDTADAGGNDGDQGDSGGVREGAP